MTRTPALRRLAAAAACMVVAGSVCLMHAGAQAPAPATDDTFDDSHFHLTNYIQQGIDVHDFLKIMGTRVGRSTLFGIPLQQQWSYQNCGDFAPTDYLHTEAPLDYGVDHIRRVLETFPGVYPVQASAEAAERNPAQLGIVEAMLTDSALSHVSFDISWDEVAKYAVATPESIQRVASVLNKYLDRFLFGTDTVAPSGPAPYFAVFEMWAPVWRLLTPEASLKVRRGNGERLFDEGRRRVRARERANVR